MKALETGILLTKAELTCLLAFVGEKDSDLDNVIFRVESVGMAEVDAYARSGSAAVCGTSADVEDTASTGTWTVRASFLREVKKVCPKAALLRIHGLNLTEAELLDRDGDDGDFVQRGTYVSEHNEVELQTNIAVTDTLRDMCSEPTGVLAAAGQVTLQAAYLAATKYVAAAAEDVAVTVAPGPTAEDAVRFIARDGTTSWIAVVMPMRSTNESRAEHARQLAADFSASMEAAGVEASVSCEGRTVTIRGKRGRKSAADREVA